MRLLFNNNPQIIAGLSERSDGSMIWWNRLPVNEFILKNRERYFKKIGINPKCVVAGGIAHGINVAVITEQDTGKYLLNTDALITNAPNLFLTVTVADCLPVYFFDPETQSIGLAHAGWRGLTAGVLENVVSKLRGECGARAENLQIIIGPHIRACHYEVREEVAAQFNEQNIERRAGRIFVNLATEAESRLRGLGVENISVDQTCVYEDKKFYSARRDKAEPLEGMMAYIGLDKSAELN